MAAKKTRVVGPFAQVVTLDGVAAKGPLRDSDLRIYENVGISIVDGKIVAIAPMKDLHGFVEHIPHPAVAMPGLIDAHTHLCFAGDRVQDYAKRLSGISYEEIANEGGGILDTVRKTRDASLEELTALTTARLYEASQEGITTCEIKSGYGLSVDSELKMLRAIKDAATYQTLSVVPTCLAAHTLPPEFSSAVEYLQHLVEDLLPIVKAENLASRVDIFVDKAGFNVEDAERYLIQAQSLGFAICVHADQFSRGGAALAAKLKALSADHLELSTAEDFNALLNANVVPVVLPAATLGLGMPFPPARTILDAGLPLVIASDWNPGSAPMGSLLTAAALLGAAQKLSMAETWTAMTVRAAAALGFTDRGRIAPGLRADLALFPSSDYREILYHQGQMKPFATYVAGSSVDVA